MNMFRAFMELDEINEGLSRQEIIYRLRALGKNYNFNRFPDKQLYGMLRDAEEKKEREERVKLTAKKVEPDLDLDFDPIKTFDSCDFCNMRLTDFGLCPKCDLGEEDLIEWVTASGQKVKLQNNTINQPTVNNTATTAKTTTGKYKVAIVLDNGRLRAMGDDGVHGLAFVAFPNHLREFEGQHFEVDQLIWNGKNYRVAGKIEEI